MALPQSGAFDHRILHSKAPERWHDGFPLGNGEIGAMVWGDGHPLKLTLDKADLWDLRRNNDYMAQPDFNYESLQRLAADGRFDEIKKIFEERERRDNPSTPTKISIGRAELDLGPTTDYECCLDLGSATVDGVIRTEEREHPVRGFVHRGRNLVCLRAVGVPSDSRLRILPLAEMNEELAELKHPPPNVSEKGKLGVLVQEVPEGPFYAVVWNISGPEFFIAIESAASPEEARDAAKTTWDQAAADGFDALHKEHAEGWGAFWERSAVYLPEERIEFLWYYGLYLLASSARRGSTPPGLQGLWAMDGVAPPWRGDYHADMNVQETFWPACASGHLDLLDSWCDLMRDCIKHAEEFTSRFYGTEGTFWPCSFFPRYTLTPCWASVQLAWSNAGWLGWLVWLRWRYSMDAAWLGETGYPLIAGIFRFYRANLQEEADGCLHIPLSNSPEYDGSGLESWCKDPNIDIALIRRCCDWVVEMEQALGKDDLTPSAKEVRAKLVPYHLTEHKALCLWKGKPLDYSHRHPSHLMAIHPVMDLTIDDGEQARAIIHASLEQYFSLGQYQWAGHTYAQMASFGAVIGRAEFAYDCLRQFAEYWIGPSGLHFNRDMRRTGVTCYQAETGPFTMEASCAASAGVSDMLVQGWRDLIRVFPAVPHHWRDIAFRDLLTEGAFRVSAVRRDRQTVWVRVAAGVDAQLRLRDPFGKRPIETAGGEVRREGALFVAEMKQGQEIELCAAGESVDLTQAIAAVRASGASRLGLR